jgi:hypothetical protein
MKNGLRKHANGQTVAVVIAVVSVVMMHKTKLR